MNETLPGGRRFKQVEQRSTFLKGIRCTKLDNPIHWPDSVKTAMRTADAAVVAGGGVEPIWILGRENRFPCVVVDIIGGVDEADIWEGH